MVLKQIGHGVERIEIHGAGRQAGYIETDRRRREDTLKERERRMRQRPRSREVKG